MTINVEVVDFRPGDQRFQPSPCTWYPISIIHHAAGWYVVVNDPLGIFTTRPYVIFVDHSNREHWEYVKKQHPQVQFMYIVFPGKNDAL